MATPHNIPAVRRALLRASQAIDFDSSFANRGTLAEDLQKTIARRIIERSIRGQKGPDGQFWDRLSDYTVRKKGHRTASVETGEMMSVREVRGRLMVYPKRMEMYYGTNVRNRRIARFFHWGTKNQPARPFFGLDQDDELEILTIVHYRARRIIDRIDTMKGGP